MTVATPRVKIQLLRPGARRPAYMTDGAAGMDLSASLTADMALLPGARSLIPTGIAIELPRGFEAQVRPRSGLALKNGVTVLNAPGTVDADYRGEIGVVLVNLGEKPFHVRDGDRIAQLVIAPVARAELVEVPSLDPTPRGDGGYGHTG